MKKQAVLCYLVTSAVLVMAVMASPGCKKKQPPMPPPDVMVVTVVKKDVPITREWVGQTLGSVDIEIRARALGWVTGMHFKEGSEVKKGTLLYTIDSTELEQRVIESKGNLAKAQTLLIEAEEDVKRYRPLAEAGAVSQRELDSAMAIYGARKGEVETARASLQLSRVNLGYTRIYAPITGLIGMSAAKVGDYVGNPPNPVIVNTISNIDSIRVRFSISEQDYLIFVREIMKKKAPGTGIRRDLEMLLSDGSLYPQKGKVDFADRTIDPATGTMRFEASFPNPQHILRPGQFAKIRAIVAVRKDAVVVPLRSLMEMQGRFLVYIVAAGNKVEMRNVKTGPKYGPLTAIDEGVKPGEKVIMEGIQKVKPDMVVSPSLVKMPTASGPDSGAR
jgi:membrane fusion protein, multidrug efflux system